MAPPPFASVRFSPDGRFLVVCDFVEASVFDPATGARLRTLPKTGDYFHPPSFQFTGTDQVYLPAGRSTGLWDLNSGRFSILPGSVRNHLRSIACDAAGQRGLLTSEDGLTRIFSLNTTAPVAEPGWQQHTGYCATLSPDGTHVVIGTGAGTLYRLKVGSGPARPLVLPRDLKPPMPASFLPGSQPRLLWLTGNRARVIDVASGSEIAGGFAYPEPIMETFAYDSNPPVRSDLKFMVVRTLRGEWQSWELGSTGVKRVVSLKEAPPRGVIAFSPNEDLVSLTDENLLRVWHLRTGEPAGPVFTYPTAIVYLTPNFSPDGKHLALGTADGAAMILDVATSRPIATFKTRSLAPNQRVLFSPDGTRLLTANVLNEMRLWNTKTLEPVNPTDQVLGSSAQAVFSANGRWLAYWNAHSTGLWDGRTGAPADKIIPAGGKKVRFSRDGSRLATGEREGHVQIWDVPGGEPVTEPMQHEPFMAFLPEFSPDGRFLRTENQNYYLWAIPPPQTEGAPPPEWLLHLATICSTKVVDDSGTLGDATEEIARIDILRREIAALPADSPYAEWGRWMLDDRTDRPIAPGFTVTPAEADRIMEKFAAEAAATP